MTTHTLALQILARLKYPGYVSENDIDFVWLKQVLEEFKEAA